MALRNMLGMETGDASEFFSVTGSINASGSWAHRGTYSLRYSDTGGWALAYGVGADGKHAVLGESELFVSFYFYYSQAVSGFTFFDIVRSGNTGITNTTCTISLDNTTGQVRLEGSTNSSAAATLTVGGIYRFDFHIVQNGTCELSVDGATAVTCTGNNQVIDNVGFGSEASLGTSYEWFFDDIWIDDAAFPPENYGISIAVPTGNSATHTGWTASAGNKWECVDEIPPTNTVEITSGTGAGEQRYAATHASMATLNIDDDIIGVKVVARMSEVTSTSTQGAIGIRSGGSNFETTDVDIGNTSDITMSAVHELNPNGTTAWTASAVDGTEMIVKRDNADTSNIACSAIYLMIAWVELPTFTGTASLITPFPIMTASGLKVHEATSALALPFPVMVADGDKVHIGSSSLVLPFPIMVASGLHVEATREGTASLVLPFPIMTASGLQVLEGAGSFILPFPIMVSSGTHTDLQGVASLVLPFPILTASGEQVISGTGVFTLPFPILSAAGLKVYTAVASMVLPFPILEATGIVAKVATASLVMPFPVMVASGTMYSIGTANLTLPFPIMVAQAFLILPIHVFEGFLRLPEYSSTVRVPNYSSLILLPDPGDVVPMPTVETTIHIPNQSAPRSL